MVAAIDVIVCDEIASAKSKSQPHHLYLFFYSYAFLKQPQKKTCICVRSMATRVWSALGVCMAGSLLFVLVVAAARLGFGDRLLLCPK